MKNFIFCAGNKRLEVLFLRLGLITKLHFFSESNDDLEMSETIVAETSLNENYHWFLLKDEISRPYD